jgi:homocysteine S-methyltransferase
MTVPLLERLNSGPLLADGAMGTALYTRGVAYNACFDRLNLVDPALVAEIHRVYIEAGNEVPGVVIPTTARERLRRAGEKSRSEGIKMAIELLEELRAIPEIRGAYLMPPFGRYEVAAEIIDAVRRRSLA